jgi:anti-sigma factor RsiW
MAHMPRLTEDDRENLVAYLDGELDTKTARALETKLNLSPYARREADGLRRVWELLDYLPKSNPSPAFTSKTLQRVSGFGPASPRSSSRTWQPLVYGVGWAAVVLLAGAAGFATVGFFARHAPIRTSAANGESVDLDKLLVRDLRVIENQRLYEHAEDINFVRELSDPDLFGDDS